MSGQPEDRRLYQEVAEAHWKEWNAKVERLLDDIRATPLATEWDLKRDIAELQRRLYVLTGRLGDVQRASDKEWGPLKEDLDAMFAAVHRAYRRLDARHEARLATRSGTGGKRSPYEGGA